MRRYARQKQAALAAHRSLQQAGGRRHGWPVSWSPCPPLFSDGVRAGVDRRARPCRRDRSGRADLAMMEAVGTEQEDRPMPADLVALVDDVAAETAALRAILDPLPDASWLLPTPAPGWAIADQVSHLAYFDEVAVTSATEPDAFAVILAGIESGGGVNPDVIAAEHRRLSPAQLRDWFATPGPSCSRSSPAWIQPPGCLVRAADERRFVADGTADGDLGARPGHRGHHWRAARADATAPARRAHRRRRPPSATSRTACRCRPSRSGSSSSRRPASSGPGDRTTQPIRSPALRSTSACWSPSGGTGRIRP